ncbi:MAG TPA: DUF86 domain-containing protein [Coriobacteriia bacterium]|nr:DUF86 domain-containing protein [Coriobacteriia bacterium]
MRELLGDLSDYQHATADELEHDRTTRYVVERILIAVVDSAVAINTHMSATLLENVSPDYSGSFFAIADAGVIPGEIAEQLAPSAGLRNALVHAYLDIDYHRVAAAIPLAVEGYGSYIAAVASYLTPTDS